MVITQQHTACFFSSPNVSSFLQRRTVLSITVRKEAMTVTLRTELAAATLEDLPTCAPACRGLWVMAGFARVRFTESLLCFYQLCVLLSC